MSYAEKTTVSVFKSQEEIRKILTKHGAQGFAFGETLESAMIQFKIKNRIIKFVVSLPVKHVTKNKKGYLMGDKDVEQTKRSRFRVLALAIKAKLECVEIGVTTLEQEFLAHILLPNGNTVGEVALPEISSAYETGHTPKLLGF